MTQLKGRRKENRKCRCHIITISDPIKFTSYGTIASKHFDCSRFLQRIVKVSLSIDGLFQVDCSHLCAIRYPIIISHMLQNYFHANIRRSRLTDARCITCSSYASFLISYIHKFNFIPYLIHLCRWDTVISSTVQKHVNCDIDHLKAINDMRYKCTQSWRMGRYMKDSLCNKYQVKTKCCKAYIILAAKFFQYFK